MQSMRETSFSLSELREWCAEDLQTIYAHYLSTVPSATLQSSLHYALAQQGKLLRPMLIYATGQVLGVDRELLAIPASAVEIIHTYSLLHDDLPCMDDADLRRGAPTCHKKFGEGIAVLTGDALHTLALHILAAHPAPRLTPLMRVAMLSTLTAACGPHGMAAGQALDLTEMQKEWLDIRMLEHIYHLKTGALFQACIQLAASCSEKQLDSKANLALKTFGNAVGLAFQIQDDLLDIQSSSAILGKPQGIDQTNHKITYVQIAGEKLAEQKVNELYEHAQSALAHFGTRADLLIELTARLLARIN